MEVLREGGADGATYGIWAGFNPCFNGSVERGRAVIDIVILTVSFNPCFNGSVERGQTLNERESDRDTGFNPCFNGSVERGRSGMRPRLGHIERFNPCFNGSVERGRCAGVFPEAVCVFQSLF